MVDIPGNSTTTRSILVGGSISDTLETVGDHDWIRIELTAGQKITINVDGISLEDSHVYVRDAAGNLLADNDDISAGVLRDSRLVFTAPTTGTYYIDVGAFDDAYAGTYTLSVDLYTPPPIASIAQIADHLASGYWGGDSHHFNVTQGGSITVNISGLTAAGQNLARAALNTWTDIIGVSFNEVAFGGQIVFDDNEQGAFSDGNWSGGIISSARVNVSTQWLSDYGTALNGYSFQTYVHEVGHALGLGHGGFYNTTANYESDALFANDGWPVTIMSYFDQVDSSYFANQGYAVNYIVTPMMADIMAMSLLYGLSTTTRVGDTIYGPSWTSNMGALCIFDSGGIDTIDVSGLGGSHIISLEPGTFSTILGEVGNVSIAMGVVIENATGGAGNDQLFGNSADNVLTGGAGVDALNGGAGNDVLIGGTGNDTLSGWEGFDTFQDTMANLSGDTIADLAIGEKIVFTNASLAAFSFSLSGSTLTYTGGSLTLTGGVSGQLVASAAAGGGVQLTLQASGKDARNDFNGDGRSDILWRHDTGQLTGWLGAANGGFIDNGANAFNSIPTAWNVAGTGDFNGDGRDDVLWRNDNGLLTEWLGTASGGFIDNGANAFNNVATSWSVAGIGDFNGDGRDDILWRNTNGLLTEWLGTPSGGFADNSANAFHNVPTAWSVAGIGDFNGDGRSDILWRNANGLMTEWLGTASGGFIDNGANAFNNVPIAWSVAGIGDFNGDGRSDILWRNDNGLLTDWLGTASGGFIDNGANAFNSIPTAWSVSEIGDFNGDGRDDILWRNDNGLLTQWLGTASGGFTDNSANAFGNVDIAWQVQPETLV